MENQFLLLYFSGKILIKENDNHICFSMKKGVIMLQSYRSKQIYKQ